MEDTLRPALLGAVDGLITTFVIIAGGVAGGVPKRSVLVIALSSLIADALSMGVSEGISSRAQMGTSRSGAFMNGLACFSSFILLGSIPVGAYAASGSKDASEISSISVFVVMLVVIGCVRAHLTGESYKYAVLEVTGLGAAAGGVAYGIAKLSAE
jgi:VIT1/CCC1 family predicted Fe2+/Mn2+ transporter